MKRLPVILLASSAYCLLLWVAWTQEDESAARVAAAESAVQAATMRTRQLTAQVADLQARLSALTPQTYTVSATWYGVPYHGRLTACGQTYDRNGYTIACNWLPMGSHVRLSNDIHAITATVNDRMKTGTPPGRVDVSERIAANMGWNHKGHAVLKMEVLP